MNKGSSDRNLKTLSVKQQLGLFVVLTKLYDSKNRPFYSSDFAEKIKPFLLIKDKDEFRRTIGGILGALSKNNVLLKVSGDKDPLWKLPDDIQTNPDHFIKQLQHVPDIKISWEK